MNFLAWPVHTGIEDLCTKRDELHRQILIEEEEKAKIQHDIRILTERLAKVNESLAKKMAARNDYDRTVSETETAYMKVSVKRTMSSLILCFMPAAVQYNVLLCHH